MKKGVKHVHPDFLIKMWVWSRYFKALNRPRRRRKDRQIMGYANWFFSFRTIGKSGSPLRVQCFKILQILAGHIVISS